MTTIITATMTPIMIFTSFEFILFFPFWSIRINRNNETINLEKLWTQEKSWITINIQDSRSKFYFCCLCGCSCWWSFCWLGCFCGFCCCCCWFGCFFGFCWTGSRVVIYIYLLQFGIYRTNHDFINSTPYILFTNPTSVSISFNVSLINISDWSTKNILRLY